MKSLPRNEKKLYKATGKRKQNKYEHVMTLTRNYIPQCDEWIYKDIEQYPKTFLADNQQISMSEHSDNE